MKKLLVGMFIFLCFIFTVTPLMAAMPFNDVKTSDWFYNDVSYAYTNGLFTGTSSTTFSPGSTMTRGMFVTVLGRMAGVDKDFYLSDADFNDVEYSAYYRPYVMWAKAKGIIDGTGNNNFSPDSNITREQMAVIITNFLGRLCYNTPTASNAKAYFNDGYKAASWATSGVDYMRRTGLVMGDNEGNFNPQNTATRAEAAAIFTRVDKTVFANTYNSGTYRVGTDIPAGEYLTIENDEYSDAYWETAKDASGSFDSLIANGFVCNRAYITVSTGQYFEFSGNAIPVSNMIPYSNKSGIYDQGMYKVGYDIAPGIYKVSKSGDDDGYYEVTSNSTGVFSSILANSLVSSYKYQEIKAGQYINLQRCTAVKSN